MWIYKNKLLKEIPNEIYTHFVYKITELKTNKIYIGYKSLYSKRKRKLKKSELSTDKRKKSYVYEIKESDWKNYNSSNKELAELITKNPDRFKKEILLFCHNQKVAKYYEAKFQFVEEVIEKDTFNGNILGKFFPKDLK